MTDNELRDLIARNAEAIGRNAKAIDGNTRAIDRLEQKTSSLDEQLSLLTRQVRMIANTQARHSNSITELDRHAQGTYDILQSYAREQNERFELIGQQIQALIDERRQS